MWIYWILPGVSPGLMGLLIFIPEILEDISIH